MAKLIPNVSLCFEPNMPAYKATWSVAKGDVPRSHTSRVGYGATASDAVRLLKSVDKNIPDGWLGAT